MSASPPRNGSTPRTIPRSATPPGATSTVDADPAAWPRQQSVHVGLQRLSVETRGRLGGGRRPLLLINGIGATGELFAPFQDALWGIDERQTITFDAPGVGQSPAPAYPPTMAQLATMVAAMIEELGHERVDVLGLSWGGALAQELAHRHPGRVANLVLAATMHGWTSRPGRPAALGILMTPARYYSPRYLEQIAPTLYGGQIRHRPELLAQHARVRAARPPSPVGYLWQLAALRRWTSLPWLSDIAAPTLVLAGDDDPIIPTSNAETMARLIPNAELCVLPDSGHLFLYLQAEAMAERIVAFLDRH